MAEIKLLEGEDIESAIRRFKKAVILGGALSDAKRHSFYLTKSQKRRQKSKVARKRERRRIAKMRQFEPDEEPKKPWWTGDTWPPDMTKKPDVEKEPPGYIDWQRNNFPTESIQEEPSTYVAGIAEYSVDDFSGVIIVRNKPDPEKSGRAEKYSFPGGGVKDKEALLDFIKDGGVRFNHARAFLKYMNVEQPVQEEVHV